MAHNAHLVADQAATLPGGKVACPVHLVVVVFEQGKDLDLAHPDARCDYMSGMLTEADLGVIDWAYVQDDLGVYDNEQQWAIVGPDGALRRFFAKTLTVLAAGGMATQLVRDAFTHPEQGVSCTLLERVGEVLVDPATYEEGGYLADVMRVPAI